MEIRTQQGALAELIGAFPAIVTETRQVLAGELHYQAMIYHVLREAGVPIGQLGMNVKQMVYNPVSSLFQARDMRKHEEYRCGFEPIPDVVIFSPGVDADWRRRNRDITLVKALVAIEVKASERAEGRLGVGEVSKDIEKLVAHREEAEARGGGFQPVVMIIDTAPKENERMTARSIETIRTQAADGNVSLFYLNPTEVITDINSHQFDALSTS
jgi:hypothetical protein